VSYTRRDLLYCTLYMSSCRTANIDGFVEFLGTRTDLDMEIHPTQFRRFACDLATKIDFNGKIAHDEEAQRRLVASDLRKLATVDLVKARLPKSVRRGIVDSEPAIAERLESIGVKLSPSTLSIVDKFPPPFDKFDWAAFAPDREDEEEFGIPRGVYFRRDRLRPLYSQALYAHEVIHTLTGEIDPEVYAAGLEEGIAEVVGTCYGGLAVITPRVLKNMLIYGRHGVERPAIWSLYRDHMRQAFILFREFGLEGLAALINRGRAAIHQAAAAVLDGSYRHLSLPRGNVDDQTHDVLEFACLGFVPSHAYSPMECLLAMNAQSGRDLAGVYADTNVDPAVGKDRIAAASARSALFMISGKSIGYSIVERVLAAERHSGFRLLRYVPLSTVGR
jgi:hypothetical protein